MVRRPSLHWTVTMFSRVGLSIVGLSIVTKVSLVYELYSDEVLACVYTARYS